jgi:hypothetical protein
MKLFLPKEEKRGSQGEDKASHSLCANIYRPALCIAFERPLDTFSLCSARLQKVFRSKEKQEVAESFRGALIAFTNIAHVPTEWAQRRPIKWISTLKAPTHLSLVECDCQMLLKMEFSCKC